jgi:hypothetical protein
LKIIKILKKNNNNLLIKNIENIEKIKSIEKNNYFEIGNNFYNLFTIKNENFNDLINISKITLKNESELNLIINILKKNYFISKLFNTCLNHKIVKNNDLKNNEFNLIEIIYKEYDSLTLNFYLKKQYYSMNITYDLNNFIVDFKNNQNFNDICYKILNNYISIPILINFLFNNILK